MKSYTNFEWLGDKDVLMVTEVSQKSTAKAFVAGAALAMVVYGVVKSHVAYHKRIENQKKSSKVRLS